MRFLAELIILTFMLTRSKIQLLQLSIILIALIAAWTIELTYKLLPCPICWIQRVILITLILWIILEKQYGPKWLFTSLFYLNIAIGTLLNIHHQYLISNYDPNASCLPGLGYLINTFGIFKTLHLVFTDHSSSCGNVVFSLLGLNIPQLLMMIYVLLTVLNIIKQRLSL